VSVVDGGNEAWRQLPVKDFPNQPTLKKQKFLTGKRRVFGEGSREVEDQVLGALLSGRGSVGAARARAIEIGNF